MALFRSRSPDRDKRTDHDNIAPIAAAINDALRNAESERAGLSKRLEVTTAGAALVAGNDSDEYLDRESQETRQLNSYEGEMRRASERLQSLDQTIAHLKFLHATLVTRFGNDFGG